MLPFCHFPRDWSRLNAVQLLCLNSPWNFRLIPAPESLWAPQEALEGMDHQLPLLSQPEGHEEQRMDAEIQRIWVGPGCGAVPKGLRVGLSRDWAHQGQLFYAGSSLAGTAGHQHQGTAAKALQDLGTCRASTSHLPLGIFPAQTHIPPAPMDLARAAAFVPAWK